MTRVTVELRGNLDPRPLSDVDQALLEKDRQAIERAVSIGDGAVAPCNLGKARLVDFGYELELLMMETGTGRKGDAHAFLMHCARTKKRQFGPEYLSKAVEINSPVFLIGPNIFRELCREMWDDWKFLTEYAKNHQGPVPLMIGHYPFFAYRTLEQLDEICRVKDRYYLINEAMEARNGKFVLTITDAQSVNTVISSSGGPYFPGHSCGEQPNVCSSRPGIQANMDILLAAAWLALTATSRFAVNRNVCFATRPIIWANGMDPRRKLTPFGIGRYYAYNDVRAATEWAEFVGKTAEDIVAFPEDAPPRRPFPHQTWREGFVWDLCGRIRNIFCQETGLPKFVHEGRSGDTALTLFDSVANNMLYIGLSQSMLSFLEEHEPEDVMPFATAEKAFWEVALTGKARVTWLGESITVARMIEKYLLPMAQKGLDDLGVPRDQSRSCLHAVHQRLSGWNGSEFLNRSFRALKLRKPHLSDEELIFEIVRRLAERQGEQRDPLTDAYKGIVTWDLLG